MGLYAEAHSFHTANGKALSFSCKAQSPLLQFCGCQSVVDLYVSNSD
jgi:hypothetical protein